MNKHRFVWHDLNTTDVDGAKRFYGELFNWKFGGDASYLHITAGEQMIGGLRKLGKDEPPHPSWLGYVVVDDVDATVKSITGAGGKVYMPATKMENVGTFAVTADPTGAVFAPWKSARPGEDVESKDMPKPFTFVWDELVTIDPAAAGAFYSKVFGWAPRTMDMGGGEMYTLFDRPGVKNVKGDPQSAGGMMKAPAGMPMSFWMAYVGVDDCDKRCEQATRLGGKVMVGPMDIPNVGRFACWSDPQGAGIAILQPKM
jgi:predicted enzyme related to lactoylglutathione lyase